MDNYSGEIYRFPFKCDESSGDSYYPKYYSEDNCLLDGSVITSSDNEDSQQYAWSLTSSHNMYYPFCENFDSCFNIF